LTESARNAQALAEGIVAAVRQPLLVLDAHRIEQQGDRPHLVLLSIREMADA
jgi:hypothetical protein